MLDLNEYWVVPGRLLAGPYPGSRERVQHLLDLGVTYFVDLTEAGDYTPWLPDGVGYRRMPIPDFDVPSPEQMRRTLALIEGALAEGRVVYVHCLGGCGRTGTVVGCYLVEQGMPGEAALEEIARLRDEVAAVGDSPETAAQYAMVRGWVRTG